MHESEKSFLVYHGNDSHQSQTNVTRCIHIYLSFVRLFSLNVKPLPLSAVPSQPFYLLSTHRPILPPCTIRIANWHLSCRPFFLHSGMRAPHFVCIQHCSSFFIIYRTHNSTPLPFHHGSNFTRQSPQLD
jgi:hypothetical protein